MIILVLVDNTWTNQNQINKKLSKFIETDFIHAIYSKKLQLISNVCNKNNLILIRNQPKNILNLFQICNFIIIFTNFVETNSLTLHILDIADKLNKKYVIISEYNKFMPYSNFSKEKKISKIIQHVDIINEIRYEEIEKLFNFNLNEYIENNNLKFDILLLKDKLRLTQEKLEIQKVENSIQLLYNKKTAKEFKDAKRGMKELKKLEFDNNRLNYYKVKLNQSELE